MKSGLIFIRIFALAWITLFFTVSCGSQARIRKPVANTKSQESPEKLTKKVLIANLPKELNSSKAAALYISSLPSVDNLWTQREINLHAALYKASYERRLGDAAYGFLLERPINGDALSLAIDLDEFRLRVLAKLSELGPPVEWATHEYRSWAAIHRDTKGFVSISGTSRRSPTHLGFRINERMDEQATVLAEISSTTPGGRSVRQLVSCTYDGVLWTVSLTGLRTVW